MRRFMLILLLAVLLALTGCSGGEEIESALFVISMAVDPAPEGMLTVTVKALSGSTDGGGQQGESDEQTEPGYIVLSATAPSCLRALNLLSATTPRRVNLSQLREVVLSRTLAETDATLSILRDVHGMYHANGEAIVVVTPNDAGCFIRRQRATLGVRLSKYLEVLFRHFAEMNVIPPNAQLSAVVSAMESSMRDAVAVYAAENAFDSTLALDDSSDLDRLPGHLPRSAPTPDEYMGAALFSGARMTGTLTGEETVLLCLATGNATRRAFTIGGAQYSVNLPSRAKRSIRDGTLCVEISMNYQVVAGFPEITADEIAARTERDVAALLQRLQATGCDAMGFGAIAMRSCIDAAAWQRLEWTARYPVLPVRARVRTRIVS